ncbi:hypothetical protein HLH10_01015 [Acinetobacter sp. ANC 4277]|uniref:hypothetical protein n=1 Tax=Acinetobacter terrae TaxID=2731247 RepID=UPI001490745D|nr:hypothetical protein [Acinetobacter terrae]NNG74918.1 hypothetical protein [Acinetobacter terrae]
MTDNSSPEKSPWGWKALIIAFILSAFFMGFFYLAVSNEPDYMPSQQQKNTQQHAFKNAPAMSEEALAEAKIQKEASSAKATAEDHHMSAEEHAAMTEAEKAAEHESGH